MGILTVITVALPSILARAISPGTMATGTAATMVDTMATTVMAATMVDTMAADITTPDTVAATTATITKLRS